MDANKPEINNAKLNKMKLRILYEEKKNLRTSKLASSDMVDVIKKIIIDEVNRIV